MVSKYCGCAESWWIESRRSAPLAFGARLLRSATLPSSPIIRAVMPCARSSSATARASARLNSNSGTPRALVAPGVACAWPTSIATIRAEAGVPQEASTIARTIAIALLQLPRLGCPDLWLHLSDAVIPESDHTRHVGLAAGHAACLEHVVAVSDPRDLLCPQVLRFRRRKKVPQLPVGRAQLAVDVGQVRVVADEVLHVGPCLAAVEAGFPQSDRPGCGGRSRGGFTLHAHRDVFELLLHLVELLIAGADPLLHLDDSL